MDNIPSKQKKKIGGRLVSGAYKATHYQSYHSFRRSVGLSKILLYLAFFCGLVAFIPITMIQGLALNIFALCLVSYVLFDYWVTSKQSKMKQDSRTALNEISAVAGVKGIIKSWHLYDGVFTEGSNDSLEIAFTKERSFLGNVILLIRKTKPAFPLDSDSMKVLRFFLLKQQENNLFISYATLSDEMVENFEERGIECEQISRRFRSKPSRWDYAVATGKVTNALWHYPRTFNAYLLSVDEESEKLRREEEAKKKKEIKEDNDSLIQLKKLK